MEIQNKKRKPSFKIYDLEEERLLKDIEVLNLIKIRAKQYNESISTEDINEGIIPIKEFWKMEDLFFSEFEEFFEEEKTKFFFDSLGDWVKIDHKVFLYPFGYEDEQKAIRSLLK
jgi:hypothetical protein